MKKIRKLLNPIDWFIIFSLICLAAGLFNKIHFKKNKSNNLIKINYTLKVFEAQDWTIDNIQKSKLIYDKEFGEPVGEILDIKTTPAMKEVALNNGKIATVSIPNKYDIWITVERNLNKDTCYKTEEGAIFGVGRVLEICNKYCHLASKIVDIKEIS